MARAFNTLDKIIHSNFIGQLFVKPIQTNKQNQTKKIIKTFLIKVKRCNDKTIIK